MEMNGAKGFDVKDAGYREPVADGSNVQVAVSPTSDRFAVSPLEGVDLKGLKL